MKLRKALPPVLTLGAGFGIGALLILTGPVIEQRPPTSVAPLVRVLEVHPETIRFSTFTHGTVMPRTESELIPEVSGRVLEQSVSLVSGGFFTKNDVLLQIDPLDYEVALEQARAGLARAESDLSNARKGYARQSDLQKHNATSDAQRDDTLNRVRIAQATVRESQAKLSRALRDLARTAILAPYDGRVRSEKVDVGQFVNRGASVATIYAVDFAEVRLPIHDEELAYLDLPLIYDESDSGRTIPVTLRARFAGAEHEWQGEVVRTEGELDPRTRMVNVIARVPDPYARSNGRPPLSVGLFVEAEILGAVAEELVVLPRAALRRNNQVFVVDGDNRLHFRDVNILRVAQGKVYINAGLHGGEQVSVSPVEVSADGMLVRLPQSKPRMQTTAGSSDVNVGS